eukprot:15074032-Alexandrium_andersonii.AAC.1
MNGNGEAVAGTYRAPVAPQSQLPALPGLASARKSRVIIDTITNRVYMRGPGDYDLKACLPPGAQRLDCTYAPSGHVMLPCAEFGKAAHEPKGDGALNLQKPLAFPAQPEVAASSTGVPSRGRSSDQPPGAAGPGGSAVVRAPG